jgi:hypothetical protein
MFLAKLDDIQRRYPEVELFIHRSYSFNVLFNYSFTAGDYDARQEASKGKVILPNGKKYDQYSWYSAQTEIEALGYELEELDDGGNRCCYNILSARVAAHTWDNGKRMARRRPNDFVPDTESPTMIARLPQVGETAHTFREADKKDTDQLLCNSCSLWRRCTHFREGSVCTLSNSPGKHLSDYFRSKDPHKIVEGLRSIVAKQADRVEQQIAEEDPNDPKQSKQVDANLNSLFRNASTLAKMVDPSLRSGVNVNINGAGQLNGPSQVAAILANDNSPKAIAGGVLTEIEQRMGIPRDQITDDMIEQYIQENMPEPVEAEVVEE